MVSRREIILLRKCAHGVLKRVYRVHSEPPLTHWTYFRWLKGPLGQNPRFGAYQLYSVADATTIAKLPESISFAEGCVLPVGFSTALVSLSSPQGQGFALPLPSLNPKPSGKTIVVWGASSSVGVMTLQLARLAGVKVVAVASPHNFELCISNGAVEVFDYRSNSIIDNVVAAVKNTGDEFVGILDCVSLPDQSLHLCIPVLEQLGGGELGILLPFVQPEVSEKIRVTHILGMGEITHQFWKDFITPALDQGKVKCLPEPLIVGEGLEALQKALNVNRKGVSGKKVVVTIP